MFERTDFNDYQQRYGIANQTNLDDAAQHERLRRVLTYFSVALNRGLLDIELVDDLVATPLIRWRARVDDDAVCQAEVPEADAIIVPCRVFGDEDCVAVRIVKGLMRAKPVLFAQRARNWFAIHVAYLICCWGEDEVSSRATLPPVKILKECRRINDQHEYPEAVQMSYL